MFLGSLEKMLPATCRYHTVILSVIWEEVGLNFYPYLMEDPFFHPVSVTEIPVVSSKIEWSFSTPE